MYGFLIVVHIIACIILISVILLQAGRGGGLAEAFGGKGLEQTIFGTRTTTFLARMTATAAVVFIFTCLSLAVLSSKRGKSLIETERIEEKLAGETAVAVEEEIDVEDSSPIVIP